MCAKHYAAAHRSGLVGPLPQRPKRTRVGAPCSTPGCQGKATSNKKVLCLKCFAKHRGVQCSVTGCPEYACHTGLCKNHYSRVRRTGRTEPSRAPSGTGCITSKGYRVIGHVAEHRMVVERFLGRPLLKGKGSRGENVHHRNGVKSENTVGACILRSFCDCPDGPHNLELWSTVQPVGKRVEDLLAYADSIIALYR